MGLQHSAGFHLVHLCVCGGGGGDILGDSGGSVGTDSDGGRQQEWYGWNDK